MLVTNIKHWHTHSQNHIKTHTTNAEHIQQTISHSVCSDRIKLCISERQHNICGGNIMVAGEDCWILSVKNKLKAEEKQRKRNKNTTMNNSNL